MVFRRGQKSLTHATSPIIWFHNQIMNIQQRFGGKRRKAAETDRDTRNDVSDIGKQHQSRRMRSQARDQAVSDVCSKLLPPAQLVFRKDVYHLNDRCLMKGV